MNKKINLSQMESVILEVLENNSTVTLTASGQSMEPLIHDGTDNVVLKRIEQKPKKGDIVFFKRNNGRLVLHRIVGEDENGYILMGDNQWVKEYGIKESQIIAVLDSIEKNGRVYKADGLYCNIYKFILPPVKWERRIKNSISLRLRGEIKNDKHS